MSRTRNPRSTPEVRSRARELRHSLTPSEELLWTRLRNRGLGAKFRRQHTIGPFIVDFYCSRCRLVVEIDGDVHASPGQAARDAARTTWLEERGYEVIRFQAREVVRNLAGVLEAIRAHVRGEDI
jgi:very-short-patch-repair endonuclease